MPPVKEKSVPVPKEKGVVVIHEEACALRPDDLKFALAGALPRQCQRCGLQAEVVAVGPGGVVDGKEVKMEVKEGDKVIYSQYAGSRVKFDEDEYIVVRQADILAIIED